MTLLIKRSWIKTCFFSIVILWPLPHLRAMENIVEPVLGSVITSTLPNLINFLGLNTKEGSPINKFNQVVSSGDRLAAKIFVAKVRGFYEAERETVHKERQQEIDTHLLKWHHREIAAMYRIELIEQFLNKFTETKSFLERYRKLQPQDKEHEFELKSIDESMHIIEKLNDNVIAIRQTIYAYTGEGDVFTRIKESMVRKTKNFLNGNGIGKKLFDPSYTPEFTVLKKESPEFRKLVDLHKVYYLPLLSMFDEEKIIKELTVEPKNILQNSEPKIIIQNTSEIQSTPELKKLIKRKKNNFTSNILENYDPKVVTKETTIQERNPVVNQDSDDEWEEKPGNDNIINEDDEE